jgi:hypothetical protein
MKQQHNATKTGDPNENPPTMILFLVKNGYE